MDYYIPPEDTLLPAIQNHEIISGFRRLSDAAQYKGSDYANAVRVERGITLEKAFEIAKSDPEIDYFVYTKGAMMVLEIPDDLSLSPEKDPLHLISYTRFQYDNGEYGEGACRIFQYGDVVFFKKEGEWIGSAPGLADTYFKE